MRAAPSDCGHGRGAAAAAPNREPSIEDKCAFTSGESHSLSSDPSNEEAYAQTKRAPPVFSVFNHDSSADTPLWRCSEQRIPDRSGFMACRRASAFWRAQSPRTPAAPAHASRSPQTRATLADVQQSAHSKDEGAGAQAHAAADSSADSPSLVGAKVVPTSTGAARVSSLSAFVLRGRRARARGWHTTGSPALTHSMIHVRITT